jgi:hypothetical protein
MSGRRRKGKLGIALAGGGPRGDIYEIGTRVALEKAQRGVVAHADVAGLRRPEQQLWITGARYG